MPTYVGLHAVVQALMREKAAGIGKCLAATATPVWPHACVSALMQAKTAGLFERLAALPTLVGVLARVYALVIATVAGLSERLVAMCTLIRLFPAMSSVMPIELVAFLEHATTFRTREGSFLPLLVLLNSLRYN